MLEFIKGEQDDIKGASVTAQDLTLYGIWTAMTSSSHLSLQYMAALIDLVGS